MLLFNFKPVSQVERENITRICNCIKALAKHLVLLYDTSIYYAFEISQQYQVWAYFGYLKSFKIILIMVLIKKIKEILQPDISKEIAEKTEMRLAADNQ